nr:hypothetical protein [Nostoc sp. ChiSLP01]
MWGVWGVWGERELMLPHPPTPPTLPACPMPTTVPKQPIIFARCLANGQKSAMF